MTSFAADYCGADVRLSPNFGCRREGKTVWAIILHYTGMETGEAAEDWLCNPDSGVSSHYLVHEDGRVVQMVREKDRAWHAGASFWAGETDMNSVSVGIEIVNAGHAGGSPDFPDVQIVSVMQLVASIIERHGVKPSNVLAHSDIAPGRKCDPGEKFPWARLAAHGLCVQPSPARMGKGKVICHGDEGGAIREIQSMLAQIGYGVETHGKFDDALYQCILAFQSRYRPKKVDGIVDISTLKTLKKFNNL